MSVAKTHRVDETYEEIRSRIVKRFFPPGTRLSGLSLSRTLKTSRTPIREALRRLQSEGFVVFFPGRGFVVNSLSLDDVNQIYTIRIPLEGLAGRLATRALSADRKKMAFLESSHREMERLCRKGAAGAYADRNKEFHAAIFRACGNTWLINILENLSLQMSRFIVNAAHLPGRMEKSAAGHREILEKLKSADASGVEKAITMHCRQASEDLMKEFKHVGDGPRPSE
jgi:DNA-binding GntR family transcriptional regulator